MAIQLACGKLTDADFARLDALAAAARDPSAPHSFKACDEFDVGLHLLIADRTGNPILAREIRRLHDITRMIHDHLETVLTGSPRIGPGEGREFRTIDQREHLGILAALKSGKLDDCRAAMVAHIRSASQYHARLFTTPATGQDGNGAAATGTQVTEDEQTKQHAQDHGERMKELMAKRAKSRH
jgi:DNA-binding GntR family transcriptional regulator